MFEAIAKRAAQVQQREEEERRKQQEGTGAQIRKRINILLRAISEKSQLARWHAQVAQEAVDAMLTMAAERLNGAPSREAVLDRLHTAVHAVPVHRQRVVVERVWDNVYGLNTHEDATTAADDLEAEVGTFGSEAVLTDIIPKMEVSVGDGVADLLRATALKDRLVEVLTIDVTYLSTDEQADLKNEITGGQAITLVHVLLWMVKHDVIGFFTS